ncbi:hypothetical protein ACFLQ2_00875 [archaeon]
MDMKRGQAMVFDAIFFLMICGLAAAVLLWAGSVYGNKSFEAYRYIYFSDYVGSSVVALSNLEYEYDIGGGAVLKPWLNEMGSYMRGDFNSTSGRYALLNSQWEELCEQSPTPLLLTLYSESDGVRVGDTENPIYLDCGNLLSRLRNPDGTINFYKFSYYSSPIEHKTCGTFRCVMDIKIYY